MLLLVTMPFRLIFIVGACNTDHLEKQYKCTMKNILYI